MKDNMQTKNQRTHILKKDDFKDPSPALAGDDSLNTKGNFEFDRQITFCRAHLALDLSRKE